MVDLTPISNALEKENDPEMKRTLQTMFDLFSRGSWSWYTHMYESGDASRLLNEPTVAALGLVLENTKEEDLATETEERKKSLEAGGHCLVSGLESQPTPPPTRGPTISKKLDAKVLKRPRVPLKPRDSRPSK